MRKIQLTVLFLLAAALSTLLAALLSALAGLLCLLTRILLLAALLSALAGLLWLLTRILLLTALLTTLILLVHRVLLFGFRQCSTPLGIVWFHRLSSNQYTQGEPRSRSAVIFAPPTIHESPK